MGRKYNNGQPIAVGYDLQSNRPIDERLIVETQSDLLVLENCYAGIAVMVEDENYDVYQWNGLNQSDISNWNKWGQSTGEVEEAPLDGQIYGRQNAAWTPVTGGGGSGDMTKAVYDTNDDGKVNAADDSDNLGGDPPSAYMTKAAYDSNNNGKADDADNLGGFPPSHYLTDADITGFMKKSTYDLNDNGIVDNAEQLGGQNPSFYDQNADITNLQGQIDTHTADDSRHLTTDQNAALDAANAPSGVNPIATIADIGAGGGGDMLKSQYDQNDNGIVDNAENLGGSPPSTYNQQAQLDAHEADTNNPHSVTKAQVGLGNVDNTSDLNKPISTATQAALDLKADKTELDGYAKLDQANTFTQTNTFPAVQTGNVGSTTSDLNLTATGFDVVIAGDDVSLAGANVSVNNTLTVEADPTTDNGVGNRAYNDARYAQGTLPTDYVSNDVTGEPTGADPVLKMVSCTQAEYDAGPKNPATFYVITDTVFIVGDPIPGSGIQSIGDAKYEGVVSLPTIDEWHKFRSLGQDEMERVYLDDVQLEAGSKYRLTLRYVVAPGSTAVMKLAGYVNEPLGSTTPITMRREFVSTETDMKEFSFYLTTVPAMANQELWIKELTLEKFI